MPTLSYEQLRQLWIRNGGDPSKADMAAAVALAESGGRTEAVSRTNRNGTNDQGLWQISRRGVDPTLQDPNRNAQIAISMSKNGSTWRPWCTAYNDGACGTKGGAYFGSSSPFWKHLRGNRSVSPPPDSFADAPRLISTQTEEYDNPCLIRIPGGKILTFGRSDCLLYMSQWRAISGGVLLGIGAGVTLFGLALLLKASTPGLAGNIANRLPGPARTAAKETIELEQLELTAREKAAVNRVERAESEMAKRRMKQTERRYKMDDTAPRTGDEPF